MATTNELGTPKAGADETQPLLGATSEAHTSVHIPLDEDLEEEPPDAAKEAAVARSRSKITLYIFVGLILAAILAVGIKSFINNGDFHVCFTQVSPQ